MLVHQRVTIIPIITIISKTYINTIIHIPIITNWSIKSGVAKKKHLLTQHISQTTIELLFF